MAIYPVIMCGGSGTRLWPASRPARPKQFLPLVGARSMFQETVLRVAGLEGAAQVVVVAGVAHGELIAAQLSEIGVEAAVLLEPEPRDSAPAMAGACAWIAQRDQDGVAVVVAADHHVPDADAFRAAVLTAVEGARQGLIVTLGVRPDAPSSAYGYISPGEAAGPVWTVKAFVEKPDIETARDYITAGYLWNSGNFVVSAALLLAELDAFEPAISAAARAAVASAQGDAGESQVLGVAFVTAPKISIDYAVMEKTKAAAVLPVDFAWSDLGAWDAVWAASERDQSGNAVRGQALAVDASDCLVRTHAGAQVTLIGVKDIAVVVDQGQVLVCKLSASQRVKTAVDRLKAEGRETLPSTAPFDTIEGAAAWFDRWLRTSALPLWWTLGADHVRGGFHEALTPEGAPVEAPRRSRVQTRQTFVYASAGQMGWQGPWRQAAWHGMSYFLDRYRRPDGLFRALVSEAGEPLDETAALYDQAFALLAMATLNAADPGHADLAGEGRLLLEALQVLRHPAGGFREEGAHPFQANAHMHLLEAAMAWAETGGGPEWRDLAAEIVELALTRFIDANGGYLREFFGADWAPASGEDGRLIEPGHQFEWAWLLARWSQMTGEPRALPAARRLYAAGLRGVDSARGVANNALNDDFTIRDANARLWPQTEWLKAALILDEDGLAPAKTLVDYLATPAVGAWRDVSHANGGFHEEPAPASSFYHLTSCHSAFQFFQSGNSPEFA
ncbi:MAG: AGE family epimerase/isomerase [Phenylobacterium sp.]|uniref:AGE family epimerase/isomerase n=1 Tax=Phenylobacterium sp. TaxID=1871053 RepID=UPI0027213AA5|nr:AGE family epimerase/isomerase [Phenylobacterium sp.]MDO8902476.1 AGE family epimerase/isomerase [Phenylobacterium sp.]